MLVYGDPSFEADPRELLNQLVARLHAARETAGLQRHAALVTALVEAGQLLQGVADAEFQPAGADAGSPLQAALARWLESLAQAVRISWSSGLSSAPVASPLDGEALALTWPEQVSVKTPEGYGVYAVYPET